MKYHNLYEAENAELTTPRYPHDSVVRWTIVNFRKDFGNKPEMLDIGCGGGRHSIFLAELGFKVSAIDYSTKAIDIAKLRAEEKQVHFDTKVGNATSLPYDNDKFSGIISYGVLCYLSLEHIKECGNEMYRVLKPGGKLFVVTPTSNDSRFITGKTTSENHAFVKGGNTVPLKVELGMEMTLLRLEDINNIFRDFKKINIEQQSSTMSNRKYVKDDWIITAIK